MTSADGTAPPSSDMAILNVLSGWCDEKLREEATALDIDKSYALHAFPPIDVDSDAFMEALQQEQCLVIDEEKQDMILDEFHSCVLDVARIRALGSEQTAMMDQSGSLFKILPVASDAISSIHKTVADQMDEWIFNISWHFAKTILGCAGEEAESVDGDSDEPVNESESDEEEEEEDDDSESESWQTGSDSDAEEEEGEATCASPSKKPKLA